jgi:hypothetical protein
MFMKNKKFKSAFIWLLVGLVAVGAVGYLSQGFSDFDYKDWFTSEDDSSSVDSDSDEATVGVTENGITLTPLFADTTTTKSFTYSVDPSVHTGDISYSLTCTANTGIVPTDYYSVALDTEAQKVSITLVAICDYQCEVTLYSVDDPDINAVVTLDYQKRITSVTSTLNAVVGSPLSISNDIDVSGGSIAVSTSVTSYSFTFADTFVTTVETILNDACAYSGTDYYYGLEDTDAAGWLSTNYVVMDFLDSISYMCSVDGGGDHHTYLTRQDSDTILALFDGVTDVFTYSAVINGTTYTTDLGLVIDDIPITGIDPSSSSIVF